MNVKTLTKKIEAILQNSSKSFRINTSWSFKELKRLSFWVFDHILSSYSKFEVKVIHNQKCNPLGASSENLSKFYQDLN